MKKHLLWIVPLAVVIIAFFPNTDVPVHEGWESPFPGLITAIQPDVMRTEEMWRETYYFGLFASLDSTHILAPEWRWHGRLRLGFRPTAFDGTTKVMFTLDLAHSGWDVSMNAYDDRVGKEYVFDIRRFSYAVAESEREDNHEAFIADLIVFPGLACRGLAFVRRLEEGERWRYIPRCPLWDELSY